MHEEEQVKFIAYCRIGRRKEPDRAGAGAGMERNGTRVSLHLSTDF